MKHQIKSIAGAVLFECELTEQQSGMAARNALEQAVKAGADLSGANLSGADLSGADLSGANLRGADLNGQKLVGKKPIVQIGQIGSRYSYLVGAIAENDLYIQAGCFFGTAQEFEDKVKQTHGDSNYAKEYAAALAFMRAYYEIWK